MIFIYPWHPKSLSARALRESLGGRLIKTDGNSAFRGSRDKTVINWGSSELPNEVVKADVLNKPADVATASNKLKFFERVSKHEDPPRIPEYTTDLTTALSWGKDKREVVGRLKLTSHSGTDIIFSTDGDNEVFAKCKLYTKYVKKKAEYRVHVMAGRIVDVQQKVLRKVDDAGETIDPKQIDFRVRSHRNGFIFQRENIAPPEDVSNQAIKALRASGLDFGAVDVIWNDHEQKAYVLEINTAPGLEGATVTNYANAIREMVDG